MSASSEGECSDDYTSGEEKSETVDELDDNKGQVAQVSQVDELDQELENEKKVVTSLESFKNVATGGKIEKMLGFINKVTDSILMPRYQDITSMFSDGAIFLVDGDSLLLNAMGDVNYDGSNGGQLLHLIYLCERRLQLLTRKAGQFEVVFFNIWKRAWTGKHTLLLARTVLIHHLKFNMNCTVHLLESVWCEEFSRLLQKHKCGFLLIDLRITDVVQKLFPCEKSLLYELMFKLQMCFSLVGLALGCVDMNNLELNISTLNAFYCQPVARMKYRTMRITLQNFITDIEMKMEVISTAVKEPTLYMPCDVNDLRHYITVATAVQCLNDESVDESISEWISAYLIYSALVDILPLKFRGCSKFNAKPTMAFINFIDKLHKNMNVVLENINVDTNFSNVCDLWHGNFFVTVVQHLKQSANSEGIPLGQQTLNKYEQLLGDVNQLVKSPVNISIPLTSNITLYQEIYEHVDLQHLQTNMWPSQLIPTSCIVTQVFCRNILPEQKECVIDDTLQRFITRNMNFEENRHWHSCKAMSDEHDRVRENEKPKAANKRDQKKVDRYKSNYAHYMSLYGQSIEGNILPTKTIVCRNTGSNKKGVDNKEKNSKVNNPSKKSKKPISKKQEIINNNKKRDQMKCEDSDRTAFKQFQERYLKYRKGGEYEKAYESVLALKLKSDVFIVDVLLYKARILWHLWEQECRAKILPQRNLHYAKELFLTVRDIVSNREVLTVKDEDLKQLAEYLHKLGFQRIPQICSLPEPINTEPSASTGLNWAEFQLLELGHKLDRDTGGESDNRVGFIPDKWQRDLFDYVDNKQSVLVVAPTSSGKTYASYYCMEEVLREGNDGVVVYVAPTKALVNQVAATIYARFKNKKMPAGKSVYGVFTRDYRVNTMNCQILITVPEGLEILMLSPRRHDWVKKLQYVIFDEIHCLAGQAGGFAWESGLTLIKCPFLALSATVEDPHALHRWFQRFQDFKKSRDVIDGILKRDEAYEVQLVVYSDRHADLKKLVFCRDGNFHHIHPYAYLDHFQVRKEGIPSSISLAPEEVFQLYKAMKSSNPDSQHLQRLDPDLFFSSHEKCTNGFLSREMVHEYERELKNVLQSWAEEDSEMLCRVTEQLNSVEDALGGVSETTFIINHIEAFIERLQEENMLPAIVFSYNRGLVEFLFEYSTEYFEDIKEEYENVDKRKPEKEEKERLGARGFRERTFYDFLNTEGSQNGVKQVGHANPKVVKYIEKQLRKRGFKQSHIFPRGLGMGIGKHHGGMDSKQRGAVEMLFRMRMVNLVYATGTLALGIHMPCKSAVILGDSSFLNSLEYQQMSGRAGRRGYDISGNVIFMGLGERKMKRLLLGKLPKMVGNIPLSVSMVLSILVLVNTITSCGKQSDEATNYTLSRALTMLECCLVYETIPELKDQMKHFFAFTVQLLMLQGLLDDQGTPQVLTGLITHLRYHEPGNLAFVFLLKSGALRRLCSSNKDATTKETEMNLILVLSYLFARLKLHHNVCNQKFRNSKVILPQPPPEIKVVLEEYNRQVVYIFDNYFKSIAQHALVSLGEDNSLPLSGVRFEPGQAFDPDLQGAMNLERSIVEECKPRTVCSSFAALSGHTDDQLYSHDTTSNIRHQVFTDMKVVPIVELDTVYNGYAWDFYNHGIASAIRMDNGLKQGDDFNRIKDFMMVLLCIWTSLQELEPVDVEDPVMKVFSRVTENFIVKYNRAYTMNN